MNGWLAPGDVIARVESFDVDTPMMPVASAAPFFDRSDDDAPALAPGMKAVRVWRDRV